MAGDNGRASPDDVAWNAATRERVVGEGREPFLRKSREFNVYAGTVQALIERYQISRAHMDQLLTAVAERDHAKNVYLGTVEAIQERYRISRAHMRMLVDALIGFVDLLQSEDHRVDHY